MIYLNTPQEFMSPQTADRRSGLSSIFSLLIENRRWMICVALMIWIPGLLYTFLVFQPSYKSEATVLIRDSAIKTKYITSDPQETTSAPSANPVLNSIEMLRSNIIRDTLWEKMIANNPGQLEKLDLKTRTDWENYFQDGRRFIQFNNPPGTDIIRIKFKWDDPVLAQKGLGLVVEGFQEASREVNRQEHQVRYAYLQQRIVQVKERLEALREHIAEIKSTHQVVDLKHEMEQYARYHLEYKMAAGLARADSAQDIERLLAYQKTLGMSPSEAVTAVGLGRNPIMQHLYDTLYRQEEELSKLNARYTEKNTKVIELKAAIEETRANIQREAQRMGLSPSLQIIADEPRGKALENMLEAHSMAQGARQRSSVLSQDLQLVEARMKELPKIEQGLKMLLDEEATLAASLKLLEDKALDEQIREDQTLSNVFVVEPAGLPASESLPSRLHMLILTLMAGCMGALATALMKYRPPESFSAAASWPFERPLPLPRSVKRVTDGNKALLGLTQYSAPSAIPQIPLGQLIDETLADREAGQNAFTEIKLRGRRHVESASQHFD